MRKVLIDECLPVQLHRWLAPLDARTVEFMGWKGVRNGDLLALAAGTFDVLLTSDRLLAAEHDLAALKFGVVIVPTKRVLAVERLVPAIRSAIATVAIGATMLVPTLDAPRPPGSP
jgi:hypothetical protein